MERVLLIDSGHGGMVGGVYQTAPHKMHLHQNGDIAYKLPTQQSYEVLDLNEVKKINK